MGFTVHFINDSSDRHDGYTTYGDKAKYSFNNAGMLVVLDGEGRQLTFSPTAWRLIEEDEPKNSAFSM